MLYHLFFNYTKQEDVAEKISWFQAEKDDAKIVFMTEGLQEMLKRKVAQLN